MQETLDKISRLGNSYTGRKLAAEDIILCQRQLMLNDMPQIPDDYLQLLHHFNSLNTDGANLFGISPRGNADFDILHENALINLPKHNQNLVLGFDELEYLVWNTAAKFYQTIDKDSFQVLNTYQSCETALLEFLKLSDDYQYLY